MYWYVYLEINAIVHLLNCWQQYLKKTVNKKSLRQKNKDLLKVAENIMRAGNFSAHNIDFYILSIINRTISLNKAFILLTENKNSLSAVSILRLQLDNLLRLNAINIVENIDDFLEHFLNGNPINIYKVGKQKLTDKFLATELDKKIPQTLDLYNYLCGYIHFSDKHFDATKTGSKNKQALFRIVIGESDIFDKNQIITFYENITYISNSIKIIGQEWINSKEN